MNWKMLLLHAGLVFLIAPSFLVLAIAEEDSTTVNLMIDMAQSPEAAGKSVAERERLEMNTTINLINELDPRGLKATIYVTGEIANKHYPLYVALLGSKDNHELALSGMSTGETLVPLADQESRLRKAKRFLEDDYICGGKEFKIQGYKPQAGSFDENAYELLDGLKIGYLVDETGSIPQSIGQSRPYRLENYSFYIVPLSTNEGLTLSDKNAYRAGLNSARWYDLLVREFDESRANGEPMSVVFTNTVSGSGDYLEAYRDFIDYATINNADIVMTRELVEVSPD